MGVSGTVINCLTKVSNPVPERRGFGRRLVFSPAFFLYLIADIASHPAASYILFDLRTLSVSRSMGFIQMR